LEELGQPRLIQEDDEAAHSDERGDGEEDDEVCFG